MSSDLFIEEINDQLLQTSLIDVKLIVKLAELILSLGTIVVGIRKDTCSSKFASVMYLFRVMLVCRNSLMSCVFSQVPFRSF